MQKFPATLRRSARCSDMAEIEPPTASVLGLPLAGLAQALRWAVLPAFAVGAVPAIDLATGGHHVASFMAALADPLSVMAARSPGARPAGALTQSKPNRGRDERVLAEALTRPLGPTDAPGQAGIVPVVPGVAAPDVPVADVVPATALPGVTDVIADGGPGPVPSGYYPGNGITVVPNVGGGGGGGGGTTTPVTTPNTPETPVASVPEPGTWAMMLLGFGAMGAALRTRRRSAEHRA